MCVTEKSKHSVITAGNGPPAKLPRRDTAASTWVSPAGAPLGVVKAKLNTTSRCGKASYRQSGSQCLGPSNEPRLLPPDNDRQPSFLALRVACGASTPPTPHDVRYFTYLPLENLATPTLLHRAASQPASSNDPLGNFKSITGM